MKDDQYYGVIGALLAAKAVVIQWGVMFGEDTDLTKIPMLALLGGALVVFEAYIVGVHSKNSNSPKQEDVIKDMAKELGTYKSYIKKLRRNES